MEIPPGPVTSVRSPISFHDPSQVEGSPFFAPDRFIIKFTNFWTIEAPKGYSVLFAHPANRADLPFTTITGLVDSDLYKDNLVHFRAQWHTSISTACCQRERRSRSAFRSGAKAGARKSRC